MAKRKQQAPRPIQDPALKQLAEESRSFAQQYEKLSVAVRSISEKYQHEIVGLPGVNSGLNKLRDRGLKTKRVTRYLADLVLLEKDATWRAGTEEAKKAVRILARQLRGVADEVEKAYSTDNIRPELWLMSLGLPVLACPPDDYRATVEGMRRTAADLDAKARAFGRLRKEIFPVVKRAPVIALLRYVSKAKPWDTPEFPLNLRMVLAELFYAICEKYAIQNSFTADSLEKTFKRHVSGSLPSN